MPEETLTSMLPAEDAQAWLQQDFLYDVLYNALWDVNSRHNLDELVQAATAALLPHLVWTKEQHIAALVAMGATVNEECDVYAYAHTELMGSAFNKRVLVLGDAKDPFDA